jgi:hypothetical protein
MNAIIIWKWPSKRLKQSSVIKETAFRNSPKILKRRKWKLTKRIIVYAFYKMKCKNLNSISKIMERLIVMEIKRLRRKMAKFRRLERKQILKS